MAENTENSHDKDDDDDDIQKLIEYNDDLVQTVSALVDSSEPPLSPSADSGPSPISGFSSVVQGVDFHFSSGEDPFVMPPSDTTQTQRSSSSSTKRKYRIHLGTRPGSAESITHEESEWRHIQLINLLSQFRSNLETLRLKYFQFDILLSNAISTTDAWGLEPYASIVFESCDRVTVEGVAAIIGRIFRQDGIGIFEEDDDYRSHPIGAAADNFSIHRFFAISQLHGANNLSISNEDASIMMKAIRENHRDFSGQFGRSSETIELHDFDNRYGTETITSLEQILENVFEGQNRSYRIEESRAKSKLLLKEEYEEAIKRANFELLATIVQITRLHDTFYNSN